jgi:protein-tyrosine phosphatase
MIDLHCHLLPGMDDGPDTLDQALRLCRLAVTDGITHAIVTPHIHPARWDNTRQGILEQLHLLESALREHDIPLQLGFAAEVRLTDQVMQQVADGQIPFYGEVDGYRIMLLEFPHGAINPGSDKLVQWLLARNIRPLIAHPERNRQVMKDPKLLAPFVDAGCWLQVTAGSVTGGFGARASATARALLHEDVVTVVASDGHNERTRPPHLNQAFQWIANEYGEQRALRMMRDTPATIVADQFRPQVGA